MRVRLSAPFVWTNWCVGLLGMTLNVHTSMCTCSGEQGIRMRGAKWPDKEVIKIVCPFYTTHTYLLIYVEGFKKKLRTWATYLSFLWGYQGAGMGGGGGGVRSAFSIRIRGSSKVPKPTWDALWKVQCFGSASFWCGSKSGSANPLQELMDPDPI